MKKESNLQQSIVIWYRNNNLNTDNLILSVPNESKSASENMYKRSIGLLPGCSDLIVIEKGRVIFVEVKTEIGTQSEKQKIFESKVKSLGFEYYLVRSLNEFKQCL